MGLGVDMTIVFLLLIFLVVGILSLYKASDEKSVLGIIVSLVLIYFPIVLIPDFLPSWGKEEVVSATDSEKDKSTLLKNLHIVEKSLSDNKLDKKEVKELLRAGEALDISVDKEIEAYIKERTVLTESKLELKIDKIVTALDE